MDDHKRAIPEAIKRQVRQECCFGCVFCGALPYEYDHFGIEFRDAESHDPDLIALLCPTHHREKTAGRLATEAVRQARCAPFNRGRDAVYRPTLHNAPITIMLGSNRFVGREHARILFRGDELFFGAQVDEDGAWSFGGNFTDHRGIQRLAIERNEMRLGTGAWDAKLQGRHLTIRGEDKQRALVMHINPDTLTISLERLRMRRPNGWMLDVKDGVLRLIDQRGGVQFHSEGFTSIDSGHAGMCLSI